ncbi:phosphotransferase family protein [Luteipulveratus flavus]|uniref:Aminoglycoside phosphotransferase family protein n=1 Tax=Luteipulveratus flavus TaxID=3031728 RepID=A0ABT6C5K7_9MICO|nr:aminoglycoside phosphotransferase family protein [Luteipulveratus sp. YIM 133296]MDF8263349.1 aminoglycoside phosphotransferase family protein [Luteipulveratus sp. YIM 133296]
MHPHGVDYTRTSKRLGWEQVAAEAVVELGDRLGSAVASAAEPVGSGFGGQYAGTVRLEDGRSAFVKAAPWELEFPAAALLREAAVLALLPPEVPHARPLAVVRREGWVVLAVEHLDGRLPGQPWTDADLALAYDACVAAASAVPPPALGPSEFRDATRRDDRLIETEHALARGGYALPTPQGEDPWLVDVLRRHGAELAALSRRTADLTGEVLCHNDLRPDNLLVTGGRVVVVDWNHVTLGPAWLDFAGLLPMARRQGLDVRAWLSRPLLHSATDQQVDVLLANIAVYMLSTQEQPLPAGCTPAMRHHQLVFAHDFTSMLAGRRGWR